MNKGYKHTEETKRKMRGRVPWNKGKTGGTSWNKGLKTGIVPRTAFKKGQRTSPETEFKKIDDNKKKYGAAWSSPSAYQRRCEILAGRGKPKMCELCGRGGKICFDHDHKTGRFRGWICYNCNTILGLADDNAQVLQMIIEYLRRNNIQPL